MQSRSNGPAILRASCRGHRRRAGRGAGRRGPAGGRGARGRAAGAGARRPRRRRCAAALQAEMAALPADQASAIDGFYAGARLCPVLDRAGQRAARRAGRGARGEPTAQALPRAPLRPERWRCIFARPATRPPRRRARWRRRGPICALATDLSAGIVLTPSADRARDQPSSRRRRRRRRCWPRSPTRRSPRRCRASSRRIPTTAADGGEGAARGAVAERRLGPGGRRRRRRCTRATSGPRVAELRARLARLGYVRADGGGGGRAASTTAWRRRCRRSSATTASIDDGVVGSRTLAAMNAPVETRLAQVVVNLERHALDERRPRRSATSWSTSPTSR